MIPGLLVFFALADMAAVKSEPDLNRRSELALINADEKIDKARQAYQAGDEAAEESAIQEVADSVQLCYDALGQSHEAPRKSKYYKRAELRVNALLRRLGGLRDEVGFEVRPKIETVIRRLSDIHDELLSDIMSKKK